MNSSARHSICTKLNVISTYRRPTIPLYLEYNHYFDGILGVVVGILAYYARGRGCDFRTVQTFVCMNMSVCIGSGCIYVQYVRIYKKNVYT
jgi:hypothetical protein